jgi:hypothetical protein
VLDYALVPSAVEDGKISVKKVETGYEFKTERVVPKVG